MSIWSGILSGVGGVVGGIFGGPAGAATGAGLGSTVGTAISGGGTTSCATQTPTDLARIVISRMTPQERDDMAGYFLRSSKDGKSRLDDPASVAFAMAGGSDCKVTTEEGKRYVAKWLDYVSRYGAALPPDYSTQITRTSGIGMPTPVLRSGGDYANLPSGEYVGVGAPETEKSVLSGLLGDLRSTIEQVLKGGVAGAQSSASAAAEGARQATASTAAPAGLAFARFDMTTILVLGVAAVALLLAFRKN